MAPLLLLALLLASGGAASGGDAARLHHLELLDIPDSGCGHASDAPPQAGVMDYLDFGHGCGRFAALVARTANAAQIFREHIVAGTGGGLTLFCPEDLAVAAFEPKFNNLSAAHQLAALLHHGVPARYGREHLASLKSMRLRTLATDAVTNQNLILDVNDVGDDAVWLWASAPPGGLGSAARARLTKAISSDDSPLAVYLVDAVLLPIHSCVCAN